MSRSSALARLRVRPLRDERGFMLIEVLVSVMLLTIVAAGIYGGLTGASQTSGINKHRSQATQIAQQDQDRMRAMAVSELSNYRDSTTSTIGNVTYTIASTASWITDDTGSASCTAGQAAAHYLRIASSVTWPGMPIPPVTVESVVAPPAGSFGTNLGSLAVQVRDRDGNGEPGVTVSLAGAKSYTDVTNSAGCVLWGYLPVSATRYTVAIAKAGYVDPSGVATPQQQVDVVGASTVTLAFDYDLGGRITATYQTLTRSGGTAVAANDTAFSAINSHMSVPVTFGDGALHASYTSSVVFPFADPYGVYAGSCRGADPTTLSLPAQLAQVDPGGTAAVTVLEPPIDLKILNSGAGIQGATVVLTATGSGCSAVYRGTTPDTTGALSFRVPYGSYSACILAPITVRRTTTTYKTTVPLSSNRTTGIASTTDFSTIRTTGTTCP